MKRGWFGTLAAVAVALFMPIGTSAIATSTIDVHYGRTLVVDSWYGARRVVIDFAPIVRELDRSTAEAIAIAEIREPMRAAAVDQQLQAEAARFAAYAAAGDQLRAPRDNPAIGERRRV